LWGRSTSDSMRLLRPAVCILMKSVQRSSIQIRCGTPDRTLQCKKLAHLSNGCRAGGWNSFPSLCRRTVHGFCAWEGGVPLHTATLVAFCGVRRDEFLCELLVALSSETHGARCGDAARLLVTLSQSLSMQSHPSLPPAITCHIDQMFWAWVGWGGWCRRVCQAHIVLTTRDWSRQCAVL
jgi:hypothetical protein